MLVPIVHFYGAKEVRYILAHTRAKALVTAARFRQSDYLAALATFRSELPDLATVVVVGEHAPASGPAAVREAVATPYRSPDPPRVDPREPAVIGFTSGTTSDPKGVIHSHHTIVAETRQLADMQSDRVLPMLVGAPVGHAIGMLSGLLIPLCQEKAIHLIDVWDPATILDAMLDADLTCGSGATYFLTSLLDAPGFTPEHLKRMTRIGLGGAPVPAAISDRAESMGISIVRSYGSTEHPSTTGAKHDEPGVKRKYTDGHALWGVELKLVDEDGHEVPAGQPGEILSRGPDRFVGYTDPALSAAVLDADGWYATGDIGVLDADGYLTITDRKKDIIIRGGENISAAEVEETLMRMPGRRRGGRRRRPRRASRRARLRLPAHAARARGARSRGGAAALRRRRPRQAEVARGDRRGRGVPAHAVGQGEEVRAARRAACPGRASLTPRACADRGPAMPAWARYALLQIPGAVLVGIGLYLFWDSTELPAWVGVLFFLFWIGKDALLYPLMRRAYEPADASATKLLIGARGVARSALAPDGRVQVQGEIWQARAVPGAEPIAEGAAIVVRDADRFTLLVAPER